MQFSLLNFRPKLTSLLFYSDDILFSRLEIILKISPVIMFTVSSQNWLIWNIFKTSYGWTALILDNAIWGPFIFYRNLKPEQDVTSSSSWLQIEPHQINFGYDHYLVDGLKNVKAAFSTAFDDYPWATIGLQSLSTIKNIIVYNRADLNGMFGI